jgi:hypothetical protein
MNELLTTIRSIVEENWHEICHVLQPSPIGSSDMRQHNMAKRPLRLALFFWRVEWSISGEQQKRPRPALVDKVASK